MGRGVLAEMPARAAPPPHLLSTSSAGRHAEASPASESPQHGKARALHGPAAVEMAGGGGGAPRNGGAPVPHAAHAFTGGGTRGAGGAGLAVLLCATVRGPVALRSPAARDALRRIAAASARRRRRRAVDVHRDAVR